MSVCKMSQKSLSTSLMLFLGTAFGAYRCTKWKPEPTKCFWISLTITSTQSAMSVFMLIYKHIYDNSNDCRSVLEEDLI